MANPLFEALGTTLGLGAARWIGPQIEVGLRKAATDLETDNPEAWHRLRHGWKLGLPFKGNLDKATILGSTAVNTIANGITSHLGPIGSTADEVVERVISEIPQILPRMMDPIAAEYKPRPGIKDPTNTEAITALQAFGAKFFTHLPHALVTFTGQTSGSRPFTRMGEQMQQAVNACGPFAVLAMSHIWMVEFNETDRSKYAGAYYALNSPTEVEIFLAAPNADARRVVLDFYLEVKKLRLPVTNEQLKAFWAFMQTTAWKGQIVPFLAGVTKDLNAHASSVRAKREAIVAARPKPFKFKLPWA